MLERADEAEPDAAIGLFGGIHRSGDDPYDRSRVHILIDCARAACFIEQSAKINTQTTNVGWRPSFECIWMSSSVVACIKDAKDKESGTHGKAGCEMRTGLFENVD